MECRLGAGSRQRVTALNSGSQWDAGERVHVPLLALSLSLLLLIIIHIERTTARLDCHSTWQAALITALIAPRTSLPPRGRVHTQVIATSQLLLPPTPFSQGIECNILANSVPACLLKKRVFCNALMQHLHDRCF